MTARKDKLVFQRQFKQYHKHCCVPRCTASSKYNSRLSFHGFPSDPDLKRRWLVNIRRDNVKLTSHSKVCSLHFPSDQFHQPKTPGGRRMVKTGAVPVLFQWNNFCVQPGRASVWERMKNDYCSVPEPAGLDMDIRAQLPEDFKEFPDIQVIVDCTELKCQTPASPLLQSEMFSKYKSHCTMKGLIGMAPHGAVTFVSSLYEGSISDKELFMRSGLANLLTEDMAIMVDKGFLISECVKCKVYSPPFLSKKRLMPAQNVLQTQKIARLRVHVEQVIRRVKENKLFDSVIPLSIVGTIN
uniref:THAP-type domain-containing protein n=1 Tax=Xiphophorus maculatus TaxID=8083 RepID=A0A3B5R2U2_XIPMA